MLYASLMESLIDKAEARLLVSERPAGVKLLLGEAHAGQVEASRTKTAFGPAHEVFTIFVDDTYVLGEDATDLCYATSALSQELAKAEQHLHPEKVPGTHATQDEGDDVRVCICPLPHPLWRATYRPVGVAL